MHGNSNIKFTVVTNALICFMLRPDGSVLNQPKLNPSKKGTLNSRLSGAFRTQNLSGVPRMQVLRSSVSALNRDKQSH